VIFRTSKHIFKAIQNKCARNTRIMTFVLPDRKRMKGLQAVGSTEREFIPSINKHALRNVFYFSCLTSLF
jgi:hypothetical protein